jgi:hypothetical protein
MTKHIQPLIILVILSGLLLHCSNPVRKKTLAPEEQARLISQGNLITLQSTKALSAEVISAINEGGVQYATEYCHLKASPLIESLSVKYNAKISRVSDRFRNPLNKPNELDLTVIDAYREQLASGAELNPHLEVTANEVIFYSPILISNPLCLSCHGEPGVSAQQENIDFILSKYPEDLATNYKLGDLRGVWKIVFNQK